MLAILLPVLMQSAPQAPPEIVAPQAEVLQLLKTRVEPEYPPIAAAMRLSDTVQFDVLIAPDGRDSPAERELGGRRDDVRRIQADSARPEIDDLRRRSNEGYIDTLTELVAVLTAAGKSKDATQFQTRLDAAIKDRR